MVSDYLGAVITRKHARPMKNILAVVDLSPVSGTVVERAAEIARGTGSRLWIVHVAAPDPDFIGFDAGPQHVRDQRAHHLRQEHLELQGIRDAWRERGVDAEALLVQGTTVDTILEEVDRLQADLLAMASHGRGGLFKALMGSVSEAVLKRVKVPVLIVPHPERP